MWRIALKLLALAALAGVLLACGARAPAPVDDRSRPSGRPQPPAQQPSPPRAGYHRVARGETLYSIAFRHGVDWRDLAHWNGVRPPYTIYPGQELAVTGQPAARPVPPVASVPADPPRRPVERPETRPPPAEIPPVRQPEPEPEPEAESAPPARPVAETAPPPQTRAPSPPSARRTVGGIQWNWPAEGRLTRRFDASDTRKGVAVAGTEGQPVVAAADGEVVYSGTGLLGYGELIIIKHSDNLLSAYGHNRRRLVAEGDRVRAGQAIAEMGRNERDEVILHFEIRDNGRPVDPLAYLPAR